MSPPSKATVSESSFASCSDTPKSERETVSFGLDTKLIETTPKRRAHILAPKLQSFSSNHSETQGSSITYGSQSDLPRLPIPSLEETLERYPSIVRALQNQEEAEETKHLCESFCEEGGRELQEALLDYEREGIESCRFGSFLEEFWNESYLAFDDSVVLNLNPFFVLEGGPDPKIAKDQLRRAASLTFAALKFAYQLKCETLRPDVFKGSKLCMDQFRVLFGSSRQPASSDMSSNCDNVHVYRDSNHGEFLPWKQLSLPVPFYSDTTHFGSRCT